MENKLSYNYTLCICSGTYQLKFQKSPRMGISQSLLAATTVLKCSDSDFFALVPTGISLVVCSCCLLYFHCASLRNVSFPLLYSPSLHSERQEIDLLLDFPQTKQTHFPQLLTYSKPLSILKVWQRSLSSLSLSLFYWGDQDIVLQLYHRKCWRQGNIHFYNPTASFLLMQLSVWSVPITKRSRC